jgi:MATE family multidrug resistance protein
MHPPGSPAAAPCPPLRGELSATARLAWPVVLGQLSAMGMTVVNTVLAGRHGGDTLAAVAVGSAVWSLVVLSAIGVLLALPPSVSQLLGAGRREAIAPLVRQAAWLALAAGVALFWLARGSGWLLVAIGITPEVQPGAVAYLRGIAWGAPAMALYFCCRYLSEGLHWTLPTMVFGIAGLALLVPTGHALLFGGAGLPALGAEGLGLATALVLWLQLAAFLAYLARSRRFAGLGLFARLEPPRRAPIAELLRVGVPMGVSVMMEGSLFVAAALVIGTMGAAAVAAHQIAMNLAAVAFMMPLGIAMATTVRVGHALGRGDARGVRRAAAAGYLLTLCTQALSAGLLLAFALPIARLYTGDLQVATLAAGLMGLAALFQVSDGVQVASAGALRGLKDSRVPMLVTLLAYWGVGMPLGWWLALPRGLGPHGMWWGLVVGLTVAAVLLAWRFQRLTRLPRRRPATGSPHGSA